MARGLCDSGKYYSCLAVIGALVKKDVKSEQIAKIVDRIAFHAGLIPFEQFPINSLLKMRAPSIFPLIATRLIEQKNYKSALRLLNLVPTDNPYYSQALNIKGLAFDMTGNRDRALDYYKQCQKEAQKQISKSKISWKEKYYTILSEQCLMNIARHAYESKDYDQAIESWENIPRTSYSWPSTLLEKAWAYYYKKDFNRALGLLVTYKSPLLESYFFPEAEILKGLSYYRTCNYFDTDQVIERYSKIYQPQSNQLKSILLKYKNSDDFFFQIATRKFNSLPQNGFLKNLIASVKKTSQYSRLIHSYKEAIEELKSASQSNNKVVLNNFIKNSAVYIRKDINNFVKRKLFEFINQMHFYSKELFKIKLQLFNVKKSLAQSNKEIKEQRARGSLENVYRTKDQYFWNFKGGFWADELGSYSFGLKNQCSGDIK